ncbi:phosphoribosyltransferase [Roseibium litorale]|uniref:Phosphoribosyltransferase n=1 Tax=Roseibium litorale TaxID=2803841 RepID=A0ABR9CPS4_9HYPH|nr:phosphoribosyltransferase [Roseibium litorale]MBD8892678.1 phosphoribosyltransferase [Roseibium litorale]
MIFRNRTEAGRLLARALNAYRGKDAVVLALPRGGVPIACEIARYLGAPLDLLLVRKLGVPSQPELAMGAILEGSPPIVVRNENVIRQEWIPGTKFNAVCEKELAEIDRRRRIYLAGRLPMNVAGKTVIIVDDGVATGATMKAAIKGLRKREPGRIVVAIPVAPADTASELRLLADEVICIDEPVVFGAIGNFYDDFTQLSDDDVIAQLEDLRSSSARSGTA